MNTPYRILIVEDDAIFAFELQETLTRLGYQICGLVATGKAAIKSTLEQKPDIIMMDIRLRGAMTGIQAVEQIHQQLNIPVVYLTAFADEALIQQAKITEAYAYLVKPVHDRELHACLEMALYRHSAEHRLIHLNHILQVVSGINQLITHEHDELRMIDQACQILLHTPGYRFVRICQSVGDHLKPLVHAGDSHNFFARIDEITPEQGLKLPDTEAARTRRVVVCLDMLNDERYAPWQKEIEQVHFSSMVAVPIFHEESQFGVLSIYSDQANIFVAEEIDLLLELAGDIAFGLKAIGGEAKRKQAEEELYENKKRLEDIIFSVADWVWEVDQNGVYTYSSLKGVEILGLSIEDIIGKTPFDFMLPEEAKRVAQIFSEITANKLPIKDLENWKFRKDGEIICLLTNGVPMLDKEGNFKGYRGVDKDITEHKRVEESLRKSEEKWRTLFEILPVGVSILDKNGNISEHNPALEKILQLTAEELKDQRFKHRKYVYFENGEMSSDELPSNISVQDQKIIQNIEVGVEKEDGDIIWTEVSCAPLNLSNTSCAVVTIDITEHKRLEKELRRSESLLSTTQQLTHVGGWEWDVDKEVMFWTKEMYNIYDLNPNRYVPGTPEYFDLHMECFLPEDRPKIMEALTRCIAEGEPYDLEFHITTVKGRSYWIRLITRPVYKDGKVIRLTGVNMDINQRKLFEKAVMEREINYTVLFNTVRQAIYIQNPDSTFISVNRGAVEMYGYDKEYFIGKTPEFLSAPEKSNFNQIDECMKLAFRGRPQKYEFWGKKKNGTIFPEEVWTVKGKYFGEEVLITLAIDITERKVAEAEIKRKNEELQKINAEKDKFFSIIAHDLKSPLSGFMGLTELMAEGSLNISAEEFHKMAVVMKDSAKNVFSLLGNLLEWSRMQRGLTAFSPELLLLSSVISENMVQIIEDANNKDITINFKIPEDLFVYADKNMLGSIFRNLASNAVKFTRKGGTITVSARADSDKEVEISITDSGIGMSKEMIENLFLLDVNTNRSGTEGEYSTGLGLIICKDLVEKHGGKFWIESEEGKGSLFSFTIPRVREIKEINVIKSIDIDEKLTHRINPEFSGLKILIAEDDETSELLISNAVKKLSKEIIKVKTGIDAVEVVCNNPDIDIVLMDIKMPEMDGYEATRQIRLFNKEVVIIAETAYALRSDRKMALTAGCNDYVSKPFGKLKLISLMKKHLKNKIIT